MKKSLWSLHGTATWLGCWGSGCSSGTAFSALSLEAVLLVGWLVEHGQLHVYVWGGSEMVGQRLGVLMLLRCC